MKALEALLQHEQKILANPPHDDIDDHMRHAYEACPYLHLEVYLQYMAVTSAKLNPEVRARIVTEETEMAGFANRYLDFIEQGKKEKLRKQLDVIEKEYGVTIADADIQEYLMGLSERILMFARERLPGILLETSHPFEKLFIEGFNLQNLFSVINDPDQYLANSIRTAKRFYDLMKK